MNIDAIYFKIKRKLDNFLLDGYYEKRISTLSMDLSRYCKLNKKFDDKCVELERQNEGKRIVLIFITTLLIISLAGNVIQYANP